MSLLKNPLNLPLTQQNNPDLNDALKIIADLLQQAATKPTHPIAQKPEGSGKSIFQSLEGPEKSIFPKYLSRRVPDTKLLRV